MASFSFTSVVVIAERRSNLPTAPEKLAGGEGRGFTVTVTGSLVTVALMLAKLSKKSSKKLLERLTLC